MKNEQLVVKQIVEASVVKRFEALENSNTRLKNNYCQTAAEKRFLQQIMNSKFTSSFSRKSLVEQVIKKYGLSIRQACQLFNLSRTAFYYESCKPFQDEAEKRLLELSLQYPNFGYWKYYSMLRNEGYIINHKRVYRIYKQCIQIMRKNESVSEQNPL